MSQKVMKILKLSDFTPIEVEIREKPLLYQPRSVVNNLYEYLREIVLEKVADNEHR